MGEQKIINENQALIKKHKELEVDFKKVTKVFSAFCKKHGKSILGFTIQTNKKKDYWFFYPTVSGEELRRIGLKKRKGIQKLAITKND